MVRSLLYYSASHQEGPVPRFQWIFAVLAFASACEGAPRNSGTVRGLIQNPQCPQEVPSSGSACVPMLGPLECEYGGDRFGRGTIIAECVSDGQGPFLWSLLDNALLTNPPTCPSTYQDAQSGSCPSTGPIACEYDEGRCACVCETATVSWKCRSRNDVASDVAVSPAPTVIPNCAPERPLVGTSCPVAEQTCAYAEYCGFSLLSLGPSMRCMSGYWATTPQTGACIAYACPGFK